jgi:hypothetical protein
VVTIIFADPIGSVSLQEVLDAESARRVMVRPVVLVVDDLQWAEPLLFDLVEHMVRFIHVALARYRDDGYVGLELFEPDDLDRARARFEELRPGSTFAAG